MALRRDRPALAMSFILPIAFFSIFAAIFGGQHNSTAKIKVIFVDEDRSRASLELEKGLEREDSLVISTRLPSKDKAAAPSDYTAATAEAAVKAGDAPVALIIPAGFGQNPISFGGNQTGPAIQLLSDASDMIAPQMVGGLLQKAAMTAMPAAMAEEGMKYTDQYVGGLTAEQRKTMDNNLDYLRNLETKDSSNIASSATSGSGSGGLVAVKARSVVGENKNGNMISFYAAAIGVMFLMTALLGGKLAFNTLLAFAQLVVMFLWAQACFKLDLFTHIPGFVVMGLCTAFAVAAFGMLLASICHTRAQLGALSTLVVLMMSSIGGSMFPRFLMPPAMQKAGLFTINAWAIDGFTKVFWRDLPVSELWPQVGVLLAVGIALFLIARRIARRWEYA